MKDKEEYIKYGDYYISKKEQKVTDVFTKLKELSMINRGDVIKQLEKDNPLRIAYEKAYKEYKQKLNEEVK